MFKWIKKLFAKWFKKAEPKYCFNCEYCRLDTDHNSRRFQLEFSTCVSPRNINPNKRSKKALKLVVNGEMTDEEIESVVGEEYHAKYCSINRRFNMQSCCGPKGRWFKPKKVDKNKEN